MGAFFLTINKKPVDLEVVKKRHKSSLEVFEKKGLREKSIIFRDNFTIFLYEKKLINTENILFLENGDFILTTGTLFYRRKMGFEALELLHGDFESDTNWFTFLNGHFSVLIFKGGKLHVFNDYNGIYHLFINNNKTVISSSFIAVIKSLKNKTISEQELFEYVNEGAMYGNKTLIKEIQLLDNNKIYQILPTHEALRKRICFSEINSNSPILSQVDFVANSMIDYFKMLKENIGDHLSTALSGGYDSRLMLALLRKVNISPKLYVYGSNDSDDVKIAQTIAIGEGLHIDHINKSRFPKVELDHFLDTLRDNFYFHDGPRASFGSSVDISTRIERVRNLKLVLNGGAGEVFRSFWNLPDRSIKISSFLKDKFRGIDFSTFTNEFNGKEYYQTLNQKIKQIIGTSSESMTRKEVEKIYPLVRSRYWMAPNNCANNILSYALTPFSEPIFTTFSYNIPLKWKNNGWFEAALIQKIDCKLAKYQSDYGFNFTDPTPPASARLKSLIARHIPIDLKIFLITQIFKQTNKQTNKQNDETILP